MTDAVHELVVACPLGVGEVLVQAHVVDGAEREHRALEVGARIVDDLETAFP